MSLEGTINISSNCVVILMMCNRQSVAKGSVKYGISVWIVNQKVPNAKFKMCSI